PSFDQLWGISVDQLYHNPRAWTEAIHPDDRHRVSNLFSTWIADGVVYHEVEFRIIQPSGAIRWIHNRGVLTLDAKGIPCRATGISTDITERKLADESSRRSELYLAEAQRLSRTGSFGWSVSSGELFWSEETYRIVGLD